MHLNHEKSSGILNRSDYNGKLHQSWEQYERSIVMNESTPLASIKLVIT